MTGHISLPRSACGPASVIQGVIDRLGARKGITCQLSGGTAQQDLHPRLQWHPPQYQSRSNAVSDCQKGRRA